MHTQGLSAQVSFAEIEDPQLAKALNEFGRAINIVLTYGQGHPAAVKATHGTNEAIRALFDERSHVTLGAFNGVLTVDEVPVKACGTLQKSLERRLARFNITGLRLSKGIGEHEIMQLAELLSLNEIEDFECRLDQANLSHIANQKTNYTAVREGETVASEEELFGGTGTGSGDVEDGTLVLDDASFGTLDLDAELGGAGGAGGGGGADSSSGSVQVDQIVAFLKGDIDGDSPELGDDLAELATDPSRLGKIILESAAIRQSVTNLSDGESLGDIILGCLRRTYSGLRKQQVFRSSEGMANLKQAFLMLEESMLEQMRSLVGDPDPELDREIIQAIRSMDESIAFEQAAQQYIDHQRGVEEQKYRLHEFIRARGEQTADRIIQETDFPTMEWKKIVVESSHASPASQPPILEGMNTLAMVFEKLETLMKSSDVCGEQMRNLVGQAHENIDGSLSTTKKKLSSLSRQIQEEDTGTIGGQGREMSRKELLSSISEVAQELMQPLTAINASLEMMVGGYVGSVTAEQRDMLGLAANSTEHLKYLMKELIKIVGCPTNKGVDSRFHTTSEEVVLMKKD